MGKRSVKILATFSVAALLPLMCSCSLFKKSKVAEAAVQFADTVTCGDAFDILALTDGLKLDYRKAFKEQLDITACTEEEQIYREAVQNTMEYEFDKKSVKVKKDEASCVITFSVADYRSIQNEDYDSIEDAVMSIKDYDRYTVDVTAEFKCVDDEWLVTNFDDSGIQELFGYTGCMPSIGRSSLIATAKTVAESIVNDDYEAAAGAAKPGLAADSTDIKDYVKSLFIPDTKATDEDLAFREAVLNTMSYEVIDSAVDIDYNKGSVTIQVTMADYGSLADRTFRNVSDITKAVESCGTVTMKYNCQMERIHADGKTTWVVTNLDSDDFAAMLSYKKFSLRMKNIDGTYKATVDVTDKFVAYVSKMFDINMPSDLEGKIYITATLVLNNGKYEVTIDNAAFKESIQAFMEKNIDKIIMNYLGTTSQKSLDTLAKLAGYADYADMRAQILAEAAKTLDTVDTSGLESSGTFTFEGNNITLKSSSDTMTGTIDNYGVITVEAPVNDSDARALLGSDKITLAFKKS